MLVIGAKENKIKGYRSSGIQGLKLQLRQAQKNDG